MSQRERELEARLATAVGLLSKSLHVLADSAHTDVIRAFLASAQPAAPARAEAESFSGTCPTCGQTYHTEAEQAVLDAFCGPGEDDWSEYDSIGIRRVGLLNAAIKARREAAK